MDRPNGTWPRAKSWCLSDWAEVCSEGDETIGDETIGESGYGSFTQASGSHTVNGDLFVVNGTYFLKSGQLSVSSDEVISGSASFTQLSGNNTANGLTLAFDSPDSGTYNLQGGNLSTMNETIGFGGTGIFNHTGGINKVTNTVELATSFIGSGTYILQGRGRGGYGIPG